MAHFLKIKHVSTEVSRLQRVRKRRRRGLKQHAGRIVQLADALPFAAVTGAVHQLEMCIRDRPWKIRVVAAHYDHGIRPRSRDERRIVP